jgi:predicted lipid-binding transport protein (Tim44 family)
MQPAHSGARYGTKLVTIQIVILAMIAAFLGLRLYSVLGRRAEHEEEVIQGRFAEKSGVDAVPSATAGKPEPTTGEQTKDVVTLDPSVERGLRAIASADRRFEAQAFVDGAAGAYRMILEAFWRGDKDELAHLCDSDVLEGFSTAIDARVAAGETLNNRLIRIEQVEIVSASLEAPIARIGLRFTADIATVTRDKDGTVIAGSLNDAIESRDVWTFSRNLTSAAPDWLLDETDEG